MKYTFLLLSFLLSLFVNLSFCQHAGKATTAQAKLEKEFINKGEQLAQNSLPVVKCVDFTITGKGSNSEWEKAGWNKLTKLDTGGTAYESKFKIMYSSKGIYLLFSGADNKITTKPYQDYENIFNGDVFEVFFHPDVKVPVYFEYEVNQLNKELILTLSKTAGGLFSWAPRGYRNDNDRAIKKMVNVVGDRIEVNGSITFWSAEIFFPYGILGLLPGVPPASGTTWNANFCRLDYDSGNMIKWSWSPTIQSSFHELDKFLSITFK